LVKGTSPAGLEDVAGRYIDGSGDGEAGSDAVVSITKTGTSIE
jgi:hypothetical protein